MISDVRVVKRTYLDGSERFRVQLNGLPGMRYMEWGDDLESGEFFTLDAANSRVSELKGEILVSEEVV